MLEEVKSYSTSVVPNYVKFIRMTLIPASVNFAGVVLVDNILRIIGGYTTSAVKTNYSYSLLNNSHVVLTSMTANRTYINACYLQNGCIYVPGGFTTSAQKTNYSYSIRSDTWETRAEMPVAVYGNDVFTFDKSIMYSAGGYNCNKIYSYSYSSNTWSTLSATLPSIRYRGSHALVGNRAYIIGGASSSNNYTNVCYCFDNSTKTVSTKANVFTTCSDISSVCLKGKIYVFHQSSVYIYDPILNTWSNSGDTSPVNFYGSRAVTYNDDVAIIQCGRNVYLYRP